MLHLGSCICAAQHDTRCPQCILSTHETPLRSVPFHARGERDRNVVPLDEITHSTLPLRPFVSKTLQLDGHARQRPVVHDRTRSHVPLTTARLLSADFETDITVSKPHACTTWSILERKAMRKAKNGNTLAASTAD